MNSNVNEVKPMTDAELIDYLKIKLMSITNQLAIAKGKDYPEQSRIDRAILIAAQSVDTIENHIVKF